MTSPSPLNLQLILRVLIVAEAAWVLPILDFVFDVDSLLPADLRAYVDRRTEEEPPARFALLFGFSLFVLAASIVSWVALWCGWRRGRLLYTATWIAVLVFTAMDSPSVSAAVIEGLGTLSVFIGGLILGLLYFSDLRHRFARRDSKAGKYLAADEHNGAE